MKHRLLIIAPLVVAAIGIGWAVYANVFTKDSANESNAQSSRILCHFFYREKTFSRGGDGPIASQKQEFEIEIPEKPGDMFAKKQRIALPDAEPQYVIEVTAKAQELVVRVSNARTKKPISESTFTINAQTENQFHGGHGFAGLSYVRHPDSDAELQYWCQLKVPEAGEQHVSDGIFRGLFSE